MKSTSYYNSHTYVQFIHHTSIHILKYINYLVFARSRTLTKNYNDKTMKETDTKIQQKPTFEII